MPREISAIRELTCSAPCRPSCRNNYDKCLIAFCGHNCTPCIFPSFSRVCFPAQNNESPRGYLRFTLQIRPRAFATSIFIINYHCQVFYLYWSSGRISGVIWNRIVDILTRIFQGQIFERWMGGVWLKAAEISIFPLFMSCQTEMKWLWCVIQPGGILEVVSAHRKSN